MPERLHPGVYVEEVSGGSRPISGVGTSTAAFVGEAARGIPDRPTFVTSFTQYTRSFGGHRRGSGGYLAKAVEDFFAAGGGRAYVVRVLPDDAGQGALSSAVQTTVSGIPAFSVSAKGRGAWSNHLRLNVSDSANFDGAFDLAVEWVENGASTTLEVYRDLRMDPDHPDYFASAVEDRSNYIAVKDELDAHLDGRAMPLPARLPTLTLHAGGGEIVYEGAKFVLSYPDLTTGKVKQKSFTLSSLTYDADGESTPTAAQLREAIKTGLGAPIHGSSGSVEVTSDVATNTVSIVPRVGIPAYHVITLDGATPSGGGNIVINVDGTPTNIAYLGTDAFSDILTKVDAELTATPIEGVSMTSTADSIQLRVAPAQAGIIAVTAPGATGVEVTSQAGRADDVPDSYRALVLSLSEAPSAVFGRTLPSLDATTRSQGYDEDDRSNPVLAPTATTDPLRFSGGTDGASPVDTTDFGRAMSALDPFEINLLALPGRNEPEYIAAGTAYCDGREDCFFIADGPGSIDEDLAPSPDAARAFVQGLPSRSANAAIFYPWFRVADPVGVGRNPSRWVPPSGHIAGIMARTDNSRGVWKAPAGLEATVPGALELQHPVLDADQDQLNPIGLNCIRQFPGTGIVVWGSRTLSADPEWRYVPVRRTAIFLKESMRRGLRWAVFEPNDEGLWLRMRLAIESFMMGLYRQGAFQGATADEAFFVQCDRDTNPQELVDQGIVTARVAFAPLKPAEFVVIQVSQKSLVSA